MTTSDLLQLKASAEGDADIQRMIQRFEQLDQEVRDLHRSFAQTGAIDDYRKKLATLEREQHTLSRALNGLAGGTGGAGGGGVANLSRALQQASYGIQDFTTAGGDLGQKIGAASNNVDQFIMGIGGPAGLSIVAGIAAAAMTVFGDKIAELLKPIGQVRTELDGLRKTIEELQRDPLKVAVDSTELDQAAAKLADYEDALKRGMTPGGSPEVVSEAGKRVGSTLAEFGGYSETSDAKTTFRQTVGQILRDQDPEFARLQSLVAERQAEVDRVRTEGGTGEDMAVALGQLSEAEDRVKRVSEGLNEAAANMVGQAEQGDQSGIDRLRGFVRQNQGRFAASGADPSAIITGLAASAPDNIRAERRLKEESERAAELTKQRDEKIAQEERQAAQAQQAKDRAERESKAAQAQQEAEKERQDRRAESEQEQSRAAYGRMVREKAGQFGGAFEDRVKFSLHTGEMGEDQIRDKVQQELMSTRAVTDRGDAQQVAFEIVRQAAEELKTEQAQARQRSQSNQEAWAIVFAEIIENQRKAAAADETSRAKAGQLLQQAQQVGQMWNGGRRFPPVMGRGR